MRIEQGDALMGRGPQAGLDFYKASFFFVMCLAPENRSLDFDFG
jgi:hypothetical protein